MTRALLGLIFISVTSQVIGQQRRGHISNEEPGVPVRRPSQGLSPAVIDSIFQIPIVLIQGTSAAAQSWYPDNSDTINKVFDIPVQTLQAVGNLVKERLPQDQRYGQRRRRGSLDLQRKKRQLGVQEHDETQRVTRQENEHDQQPAAGRTHHSLYDPFAWTEAIADLLVGHGGLLSDGLFGGHGNLFGGHGHHGGHRRKKKKKKRPHGTHHHILGGHLTHTHQHFQAHNPFGGHQILGGESPHYEVTEIFNDIKPLGFFSFLQPSEEHDPIENKIAPKFDDIARFAFP